MFRVAAIAMALAALANTMASAAQASSARTAFTAYPEAHRGAATPEILGVTYPLSAPPDLIAPEQRDGVELPNASGAGAAAAAAAKPAEPPALPAPTLRILVDLGAQQVMLAEHGTTLHTWPISSGRAGYATPAGSFHPQWSSRMWYSRKYDMAPMPYAVFFNGGIAFHATAATHLLGRPASHGCIRLAPANARLLYGLIHRHGYTATEISVAGTALAGSQPTRPAVAEPRKGRRYPASAAAEGPFPWTLF